MTTQTINPKALEMIEAYTHLKLGGKEIVTPYFINSKRSKDLRAMVGKGTPEEIIMEAKIWEKLKGIKFDLMEPDEIKQFLVDRGLGIDCSGFVVHVLNHWYKFEMHKNIWSQLKIPYKTFRRKLGYFLRPVENMGADVITSLDNAVSVSINEVAPSDLIRSKAKKMNGDHVLLVTEVTKDESGNVKTIKYVQSNPNYGKENGVRFGTIEIIDPSKPLQDQKWNDSDEHGVNHTLEGFLVNVEDNGLRRLKCLNY